MIKPHQALPDLWFLLKDLSADFLIVNHEKIYNFVLYVFYYAGAMPHTQFFNNYFYQNSSLPRWYDFNVHYLSSRQKIDILVSCVLHAEVGQKIEAFCVSFILKIVDSQIN